MFAQEGGFLRVPLKDVPRAVKSELNKNVWQCGEWSFDIRDDYDLVEIEKSILAWVSWHNFVRTGGYGTLEEGDGGTEA
jgi:hypothetical protein